MNLETALNHVTPRVPAGRKLLDITLVRFWTGTLRRDRTLAIAGAACMALVPLLIVAMQFDSRTILGVNAWLKPLKFALSFAIYLWTLAWLVGSSPQPRGLQRTVAWGAASIAAVELFFIHLQSFRGTTSHFNFATPFDAAVFRTMGAGIAVNTLLVAVLFLWFCRPCLPAQPAYRWGARLGLGIFLLGSLEGLAMVLRKSHAIGLPDGGPGMPLLNWSTMGGDLRVAHFLGLHALQLIPLFGFAVDRLRPRWVPRRRIMAVAIFAIAYAALVAALFASALMGMPLVPDP